MKICKKCNTENPDDAAFCRQCGSQFKTNSTAAWIIAGIILLIVIIIVTINNQETSNLTGISEEETSDITIEEMFFTEETSTENLDFLNSYAGKYPSEINLLENKILRKRLVDLLPIDRLELIESLTVETPIEIENNIFKASGCQQHNCDATNYILIVDLKKDILYVGIKEEYNFKLYPENDKNSYELNKWVQEQQEHDQWFKEQMSNETSEIDSEQQTAIKNFARNFLANRLKKGEDIEQNDYLSDYRSNLSKELGNLMFKYENTDWDFEEGCDNQPLKCNGFWHIGQDLWETDVKIANSEFDELSAKIKLNIYYGESKVGSKYFWLIEENGYWVIDDFTNGSIDDKYSTVKRSLKSYFR